MKNVKCEYHPEQEYTGRSVMENGVVVTYLLPCPKCEALKLENECKCEGSCK